MTLISGLDWEMVKLFLHYIWAIFRHFNVVENSQNPETLISGLTNDPLSLAGIAVSGSDTLLFIPIRIQKEHRFGENANL